MLTLAEGSVPWLIVGFITACVSPAVPFVARWAEEQEKRRAARLAVVESSVLLLDAGGPSSLLAPDRQVVPFHGRAVELEGLVGWCQGEGSPLRLITGPGGVGKSRLAAELKDRLTGRGWVCVAVGEEQEQTILARVRSSTDRPILLVVDYADTRHELDDLVRQIAADPSEVRVLLIARTAGEWWQRLTVGGPKVRELIQGAYDGNHLPVRIDTEITDQQIVDAAAAAFARQLGIPTPQVQLRGTHQFRGRVLDLHAASLVAVLRAQRTYAGQRSDEPLDVDVAMVLNDLLGHEQRHWIGTADRAGLANGPDGLTIELLRWVVAAVYLAPPSNESEALELLARVHPSAATPKVLRWLRDLYPTHNTEHWIGTLQPDRMAELHLVNELSAAPALASALLDNLDARTARNAVAVLARAAADHFSDHDVRARAIRLLDRTLSGLPEDLELLRSISPAFPYPSELLTRSNLSMLHRILDLTDPGDAARRSWVLHDIGTRLHRLDRNAQAFEPLSEAIRARRQLAATEPGKYAPHLAASLRYLGLVLSDLGQANEALAPTLEALRLEQHLPKTDRRNRLPYLARTLCDLGARYHEAACPSVPSSRCANPSRSTSSS
ncbi:hypothetical protein [Promicromonospora sp. NPDC019610]|uniref:hypothetical protein n=1 Tax=Promicromonospora sp. NPDC019610 TaxID=3364405 RepID=UPI00378B99D9